MQKKILLPNKNANNPLNMKNPRKTKSTFVWHGICFIFLVSESTALDLCRNDVA